MFNPISYEITKSPSNPCTLLHPNFTPIILNMHQHFLCDSTWQISEPTAFIYVYVHVYICFAAERSQNQTPLFNFISIPIHSNPFWSSLIPYPHFSPPIIPNIYIWLGSWKVSEPTISVTLHLLPFRSNPSIPIPSVPVLYATLIFLIIIPNIYICLAAERSQNQPPKWS